MSNVPQTPNFKLFKPPFDRKAWHQYVNKNFETIDAVLTTYLDVGNIVGVWDNSTSYLDGDRVIDPDVGQVFEAAQNHTSAASPTTFAQERIANPTYWTSLAVTARGLGAWAPGTLYQPNDFVVDGSIYAVCITTHTSSGSFANDIANWDYLIDLSVAVTLPSLTGKTLQVLRVNAGETAAEWTTAANIASWLSGLVTPAAHLHLVADLSDASPDAKALLQAANDAAIRTELGLAALATLATVGTAQIDNDSVTYAKMQNISAASRLLGRGSAAGAGDPEEFTVGSGLSISGTVLNTAVVVDSGTYTPTLTNVTNVAASTPYGCQYMRVGSVVTVSGRVDIDPTAAASSHTELGISLPIASNFAALEQCCGAGSSFGGGGFIGTEPAGIVADVANDRASLQFAAQTTANHGLTFTFTYRII